MGILEYSLVLETLLEIFPVQTPLGARPGLRTQPRYEAPSDLRVKNVIRSD